AVSLPAVQAGGVAPLRGLLASRRVSRRPSTLQMVKEALQAQGEKGASVVTIKQFILAKYPTEDPIRLKYLLKQALSKGLSRGELVRPRNSSAVGATGTFMVSRGCWRGWAGAEVLPGPTDTLISSPVGTQGDTAQAASGPGRP
ncbi:H1FOO protein, partial [Campylorhamphus procurvoides]|nr:H1FOO protein [Campylorhamphus procurvoides]